MQTNFTPEFLEIIKQVVELNKHLALTNQSLANIGGEVGLHNKLIYGDETGKGGLLNNQTTIVQNVKNHDEILDRLEKNCGLVVEFMNKQMEINKSIYVLRQAMWALGLIVILILILIGVADLKGLQSLLSHLPIP